MYTSITDLRSSVANVVADMQAVITESERQQISPEVSVPFKSKYGTNGVIAVNNAIEVFYEALRKIESLK